MPPTTPPPPIDQALATSSNAFALELWARTSDRPGNLAMSPASISLALAMTAGGARGATYDELARALHFRGDPGAMMAAYGKLSAALTGRARTFVLRIANRLFGEQTFAFEKPYLEQTGAAFGAPLEPVDFRTAAEAARGRINHWVEDQTEKRIENLLPAGSVGDTTRLVLVNAIYFLADWMAPFEPRLTQPRPFSVTRAVTKSVPMMVRQDMFQIAKLDGGRLLELPYQGDTAAMWIALPDKVDGLAALEASLDATKLAAARAALAPQEVRVSLPRFTIDPAEPLRIGPLLRDLGITTAFNDHAADFTAIGTPHEPGQRLYISAVFHKAFVKVDEKGTEAAAATAVAMPTGGAPPANPEDFTCNRPFLFFIVDRASGLVLFVGRVVDPS